MKIGRNWLAVLLALSATGCAQHTVRISDIPPLEGYDQVKVPATAILTVSAEMRQFLARYASQNMSLKRRAWALAWSTSDPMLLGFDYDPGLTLSARDAFAMRSGNCLSFSSMLVALAREAGLKAWYQQVDVPPAWENDEETMLVSVHVNAVLEIGSGQYTVDVSGRKMLDHYNKRKLTDKQARAQHFNNKGVDALLDKNLAQAHAWFKQAILTDPSVDYIWSNLGVVYKRNGQLTAAIWAYDTALEFNPGLSSASNNLYVLHESQGNRTAAAALRSKVERHRNRSPWHLAKMSLQANEEGQYEEAIRLLRRAIRLESRDYRLHLVLAQSLLLNGETEAAQKSLERARTLAPNAPEFSSADPGIPFNTS